MDLTDILALHLYSPKAVPELLHKLRPALNRVQEVWFSSATPMLSAYAMEQLSNTGLPVRTFIVDNSWHDWSGYLSFLRAYDGASRLIIGNDSIVTRRVLSARSVQAFMDSLADQSRLLAGELDTSSVSAQLQSWSSPCWISTYLFALSGITVDVDLLEKQVKQDVSAILSDRDHLFFKYLASRRPGIVASPHLLSAKLGAMCFERRLTRLAMDKGITIVHAFAGNPRRKIERWLERLRDY